ncbi:DNA-3-methyladenine glycosylase 2 family protein [Nocardioides sp. YIM 152315]|uniref:DNA-3-methyladenine glycosylase family protein n=1 Tax=Nocardioides sp. YIM 152315 TaxID=3031760 RepID=UPI0023DC70DB|nr:DNA-3-methyladenine glycosylase 2 family protein [Nocardioides sp. YIM 152315]MDF1601938.1 DNA-3-methyladenine glycosylase 2 family protein [Nocardioides sp. YIM 152315]
MLAVHKRGGGDPTYRIDGERHWRGIRTPQGAATLAVEARSGERTVRAEAWGPGADWVLEGLPALLGADDDVATFEPRHPIVAEGWRRYGDWRIGRSGLVMEALTPAVIEQRVTGQEAFAGFRMLVHRYGERAPGPGADLRLWVQPGADTIRRVPSWEWLRMHVDPARSRALVTAARVADSLERTVGLPGDEVERRLTSLPGIGVWTAAEVRQRAHGDADAVSFGDYHVAPDVGWAVAGRPFDDDELADFLEPWRPHRGRVPVLLGLAAGRRPRRGPRMAPRTHLPARVTRG